MVDLPKPSPIYPQKPSPLTATPGILQLEREARIRTLKKFILGVLVLGLAFTSGWTLDAALSRATSLAWFWFLLSFVGFLSFLSLAHLILSWRIVFPLAALGVFLLLFPFWKELKLTGLLIFSLLTAFGIIFAGMRSTARANAMLKVSPIEVVRPGLSTTLFFLSILFAVLNFLILRQGQDQGEFFLKESGIRALLRSSESVFRPFVRNFNENITAAEFFSPFLQGIMNDEYQRQLEQPGMRNLPETELNQLLLRVGQEVEKQFIANIAKKTGLELTGKEPLSQALYQYIFNWYQGLSPQNQKNTIAIWGVVLFLLLWSFSYLLILLFPFFFWIVFRALEAINFMKIARVPTEREALTL